PRRFLQVWNSRHTLDELHNWRIVFSGTEGYDKAEVTAGGVDTNEVSSQTIEAKSVPGLYFIGEVVDVTGQLGGFNFQWARASGFAEGRVVGISRRLQGLHRLNQRNPRNPRLSTIDNERSMRNSLASFLNVRFV